jgi:hypothetical protein
VFKFQYYGIFVQSKNCGARETAVAKERLSNNIRFQATATKQTSTARQHILNRQEQTVAGRERHGKHVPAATDTHTRMNGDVCAGRASNKVSSLRESEENSHGIS